MTKPAYQRVLLKLSGEALSATSGFGIDQATVERLATDLAAAAKLGVELGVVVGGGNIFRGVEVSERGEGCAGQVARWRGGRVNG